MLSANIEVFASIAGLKAKSISTLHYLSAYHILFIIVVSTFTYSNQWVIWKCFSVCGPSSGHILFSYRSLDTYALASSSNNSYTESKYLSMFIS